MRWNFNEEFIHPDNQLIVDELFMTVTLARGTHRLLHDEAEREKVAIRQRIYHAFKNKKRYTRVSENVGGREASKSKLRSRKARASIFV
jgi:hypothetical protein